MPGKNKFKSAVILSLIFHIIIVYFVKRNIEPNIPYKNNIIDLIYYPEKQRDVASNSKKERNVPSNSKEEHTVKKKDKPVKSVVKKKKDQVKEVIMALGSTMEGDTTNFFIFKKIKDLRLTVSTIARGMAVGDQLEYTDEITLGRSITNRLPYEQTLRR